MKYEEVPGRGIGVFYHTPSDDHLYRKNKVKNNYYQLGDFNLLSTRTWKILL